MLENKKAVIFDLDGTLVDSMWMWKEIDFQFLSQKGVAIPEDIQAFQDQLEGMGFTETASFLRNGFILRILLRRSKKPGSGWQRINTAIRSL